MKIFLKLKHWQMFLLWIGGSIQMEIFMRTDFWFISFGIYLALIFGWIYSIGKILNKNDQENIKKLNIWSIAYLISIVPFIMNFRNTYMEFQNRIDPMILIICGIIGIVSMLKVVNISAKSLKKTEKKEKLAFKDYAKEFFLVLYMIIGIWILQPKLNTLNSENKITTGGNVHN